MILGSPIHWRHVRKYWPLPLFLPAVSATCYFVAYWPLSFAMPRFVNWYLFSNSSDSSVIATTGTAYPIANLINLLMIVIAAPVVEEFIFRGLLLTRWTMKWGAPRAILLSSVIFGVLHKEFLGHMFFGFVMASLYIESKSLFLPMLIHAANNALAFALALLFSLGPDAPRTTLASFQAHRGGPLFLAAIFIPLAVWYLWRHLPKSTWQTPFETNRISDPPPAALAATAGEAQ
jgi:membrane protease YdiL (CAAX protease family)